MSWLVAPTAQTEHPDYFPAAGAKHIEARFGVHEPNISAWRRQTCGDLTSAFRFGTAPSGYPRNGELALAVTKSRLLRAQAQVNDNPFRCRRR